MSFDLIPRDLLVKIFHRLPFKDRVHLGSVNRQFSYASDESINKMKSLDVTDDLMNYILKTQTLLSLLESCAPFLESIDVSSFSCNRLVVRDIADFVYPNLKQLKIMDSYEDLTKMLLSRNRNLSSIGLHLGRMEFEWPDEIAFENLEELDILVSEEDVLRFGLGTNLSSTLSPLIGTAPNLKLVSIKTGQRPAEIKTEVFNDLLASVPNLEELSLQGYCNFFRDGDFWALQLPSLTYLKINYGDLHYQQFQPSIILHNFSTSFPRLKSFISNQFKKIDNRAIVELSSLQHLRELRLPYLEMTKQEFIKMVDWLPSIVVLEIGTIKSMIQIRVDGIRHQVGGETKNGAVVAPSHLHELHVHSDMTKAVLIDVITHLPSIAILQINAILGVPPELFIDFLTTTTALFRPNLEIRLSMQSSGFHVNEMNDINEMKAALKDLEINGGPVVTFNPHRTRN